MLLFPYMLAEIGNEEVGRWVTMPVTYPGNDNVDLSKYMFHMPHSCHFNVDAVPGLTRNKCF